MKPQIKKKRECKGIGLMMENRVGIAIPGGQVTSPHIEYFIFVSILFFFKQKKIKITCAHTSDHHLFSLSNFFFQCSLCNLKTNKTKIKKK